MIIILIVGPLLEEKYGSGNILAVIFSTAIITGIINFVIFPELKIMGTNGVVLALIIFASFSGIRNGKFPVTLILVAVFYLSKQIYEGFFDIDMLSQVAHTIGGVIGASCTYLVNIRLRR